MTDVGERIDADFAVAETTIQPREFVPYRETLRVLDRMLDLLDRVIDQNGVK
ncbi:hypothetical protein AB0P00_17055 [Microbacterium sp. NPDC077057]|uniref:hypothetical protein n=1 Tax=Microbacterium sp. NPDC077057 TaxID=3154763 RepID=UPI00341F73A6